MHDPIAERLGALPHLSKAALCDLWKHLFGIGRPTQLRRDLMIPILGYRIQEQAFGTLSPDSRRRLRHLARAFEVDPTAAVPNVPGMKLGTRLVRQWRDKVHVVTAEEGGYEYRGRHYENLSEIARLITGTRWSGPLFFGLKKKQSKNFQEAA